MKRLTHRQRLLIGATLFSMFFGAGNLIFPPFTGYAAGAESVAAFIGLASTAVLFPVFGVIATARAGGAQGLCRRFPSWFATGFIIVIYLCIGPMLAIPRTASTSYSMFSFLTSAADGVSLGPVPLAWVLRAAFSALFFFGSYHLALRPSHLKDVLGRWMTPVLLALIGVLFVAGVLLLHDPVAAARAPYAGAPFARGFVEGYQTMDALAALVFGIVIAMNIRACGLSDDRAVARETARAGLVAGVCLALVYGLLCWLGARASAVLPEAADGTAVLSGLCLHLFGTAGPAVLAAIFFVACFNVCTGLLSSCAAFFAQRFARLSFRAWLRVFTVASFLVSILGLELILQISVPILTLIYPAALTVIVLNLVPLRLFENAVFQRVAVAAALAAGVWSLL